MSSSPDRTAQLERDLRAAGRVFDDVTVSGDAWQQNQQRLAADRGHRGRILLAVAAGLVLVVAVGALVLGGGTGGKRTLPGDGGGDPFGDSVVLGPPVDVETLTIDGVETTHQAVLSDQTGKGPNLCDRYVSGTGANGGCSSRDANADDPDVAFDWLTATTGGGDIRGVLAGVDSRVMKVQIWMDNGDMTLADLKPGGWEGTNLFALTVPADGPRPQRLVAYSDASGTVLQALDLGDRFGADWLRQPANLCSTPGGQISSVIPLQAVASANRAHVVVETSDGQTHDACFPVRAEIQGAGAGPRTLVVVVAPEVADVAVGDRDNTTLAMDPPRPIPGSLWRVAAITLIRDIGPADSVTAFDQTGNKLAVFPLGSLK
jgi:hypothetical protein